MNEKFVDPFGQSGEDAPAHKGGYSEAEVERMNRVPPTEKPPAASDENPDPEDPDREQAIRDSFGYGPGERRSQAERAAAAQRMLAKAAGDDAKLPADIAAIWGHSPDDMKTAQHLIGAWGLDRFRDSQLHKAALQEARSAGQRAINQRAFLDAQKRLKK